MAVQAIIKKQGEQIKSLEAYNRAATTKNALAIGLSATGMAAVRLIVAAASRPGSASAVHAAAPVAAAPAATDTATAPAAARVAAAAPQPRGRAGAAAAGAGGPKGVPKTPAGERVGRDGRGSGPAPAQEDSNGRSPRSRLISAAVTSAGCAAEVARKRPDWQSIGQTFFENLSGNVCALLCLVRMHIHLCSAASFRHRIQ